MGKVYMTFKKVGGRKKVRRVTNTIRQAHNLDLDMETKGYELKKATRNRKNVTGKVIKPALW